MGSDVGHWNMAELQTFRRDAPIEAMFEAFERDGGLIVLDLLSDGAADQIVADLAPGYDSTRPGSRSGEELWENFHGKRTIRFTGLAGRSDAFVHHALLNPVVAEFADHYLLPHCADYWLNTGQIMAVGPGEPAQFLHRDENNWPEVVNDDYEVTVSCMYALSDFTENNGATVVIPGTQHIPAGTQRGSYEPRPAEDAYAVMPKGAGMIYSGKVIHGAGHNRSDQWRHGMHVSFVHGYLRPEEASPLMVDRGRAADLPERARQLLGWSSYHSRQGGRTWLVDFEDAAEVFRAGT
jgi:ectoine hydroxylase-related dioxygenase (phytanoyl-CoA dioxygenase family)